MSTVGHWLAANADLDRRDREVLLCRAAGLSRAQLLARPERPLGSDAAERLRDWSARRRRGEPVAYIIGEREFWGLALEVSPAVLVPRPETELLVEAALDWMHRRPVRELLELGTGSGAVAIALALEAAGRGLPVRVSATDVSPAALTVAAGNARRHGAEVRWLESNWFAAVAGRYHLIVANPPYVAADDPHLEALAHEPRLALVAGAGGLDAIRAITAAAPRHLVPGGALLLEHGWDQGAAAGALLTAAGFTAVETLADLAGHDRVTRGVWQGGTHEP